MADDAAPAHVGEGRGRRVRRGARVAPGAPAHRLRAPAHLGRRQPDRRGEPRPPRKALRHPPRGARRAHRRGARLHGPRGRRRRARADLLRRDDPAARDRAGPAPPARDRLSRRAHRRPRSPGPALGLGAAARSARPLRHHGAAHHPRDGRGRGALRARRDHGPRAPGGRGHAGAAHRLDRAGRDHGRRLRRLHVPTGRPGRRIPRSHELAAPPHVSAEAGGPVRDLVEFGRATFAVAEMELRKLLRDPTEVLMRSVQPTLWLLLFGQVLTRLHAIPTGRMSYLEFMTPGVLAQSVLFTAIFYGIAVIWERDLGILQKLLITPAPRSALVLGKALSAGFRGAAQAVIIYIVALLLGVRLRLTVPAVLGVLLAIPVVAALFSTFSLVVACLVETRERFMGIGQVLTMPLFFASSAIYPVELMPGWLRVIARANPLTYLVDLLRALMVEGGHAAFGLGVDLAVQLGTLGVLVLVASRLYPTVVR